jgi:hypothetical protein
MTLSIKGLYVTVSISDTHHIGRSAIMLSDILLSVSFYYHDECHCAERRYAECRGAGLYQCYNRFQLKFTNSTNKLECLSLASPLRSYILDYEGKAYQ